MDRMTELELFVLIADLGTMSKAAEAVGISNAAATRYLVSLEGRLNVRLVERNTRRLSLTPSGHQFYTKCKFLLAELKNAEAAVHASTAEPSGTLTITTTISFAKLHIAPILADFRKKYPKIRVNIIGANRYYDIMDTEIDLAIRTREFEPDSNITVRRLAETSRILAASRGYLAARGRPNNVEDLVNHDMLIYSHANQPRILRFTSGSEAKIVEVDPVLESNDGQIIVGAAKANAGILVQPMYIIHNDIVSGELIPLLTEWKLPKLVINIAYHERTYMPAKTKLFIDFLDARFKEKKCEKFWTEI